MPAPAFVICDTDALLQFLIVSDIRALLTLRNSYRIQPLVVPEVEIELRSHRRYATRVSQELTKLLGNGVLKILDKAVLAAHFGGPPSGPLASAQALAQIQQLGAQLYRHCDTGEAYSHAAAITLDVPAMSHDRSALDAILNAGLPVPKTVLRAFDLLSLSFQIGYITANDCDQIRSDLVKEGEWVPKSFNKNSFVGGLQSFCPRLHDLKHSRLGGAEPNVSAYSQVIDL